jgi:enoyl-CoA hydratase/carnithine racemase
MAEVVVEHRGPATWIRLCAPERRNAYDPAMAAAITKAVEESTGVHAVVITGSQGSFCAGGSLQQLSTPSVAAMRSLYRASLRLFDAIRQCPRPVIAAVNGPAAGGGNELVIACDLAVAGRSATFGQTGPRIGSAPVTGATNVMSLQIGEKRAKELSILCRRYTAAQALSMGLVNEVVEDDDVEAKAGRWCEEIAALSPRYVEIAKISSNVWWNAARDSFSTGLGMLTQAVGSDDMIEGATAFLEKRKPVFPEPA